MRLLRWTPRLRVRVRSMMILIAVVAVCVSSKMRHDRCVERARFYESKALLYRNNADMWGSWIQGFAGDLPLPAEGVGDAGRSRNRFRDLAVRCDRLRADFERVAWIPFAPMPAEIDPEELVIPGWNW